MYPQRVVRQALRLGLPRPIAVALLALLLALVMLGCSVGEGTSNTAPGSEEAGASHKKKAPEGVFDLPNGRSLYIECLGSGSPTIVLETGQNMSGSEMYALKDSLARNI